MELVKILLTPDGSFKIDYPTDRPMLVLKALKGALSAVEDQAAAAEHAAAGRKVMPARAELLDRLNGR